MPDPDQIVDSDKFLDLAWQENRQVVPWRPENIDSIRFGPANKISLGTQHARNPPALWQTDSNITKMGVVLQQGPVGIEKPLTSPRNEFRNQGVSVSADTSCWVSQGPGIYCNSHQAVPAAGNDKPV